MPAAHKSLNMEHNDNVTFIEKCWTYTDTQTHMHIRWNGEENSSATVLYHAQKRRNRETEIHRKKNGAEKSQQKPQVIKK